MKLLPKLNSSTITLILLCYAPVHSSVLPSSIESKIDSIIAQQKAEQPGLSLIIRHRNKIIINRNKGLSIAKPSKKKIAKKRSSQENKVKQSKSIGPNTSFRLASVSKPFTALAIMQLFEKGDVKLSDSIRHHLPELSKKWQPFTLHHLLSHRASVSKDFFDHHNTQRSRNANNTDAIKFVNSSKITVKALPENEGLYCNICYVLLAETVSRVSNESFAVYMQKHIFNPANMNNSYIYDSPDKLQPTTALNYGQSAKIFGVHQYNTGAMGQVSSAQDINNFIVALKAGKLIQQSTLDLMTQIHADHGDDGFYGLGWTIGWGEQPFFSHGGSNDGYESELFFYPKHELEVIILSNGGEETYVLKRQIMRAVIKYFNNPA